MSDKISRARLNLETIEDRSVPATLSVTAWYDANANGTQDAGEAAAEGVGVIIVRPDATTTGGFTDAAGNCDLTGLAPGSYMLNVTAPVGYSAGVSTAVYIGSEDVGVGFGLTGSGSGSGSMSGSGSGTDPGSGSGSGTGIGSGSGSDSGSTIDHYPEYLAANSQAYAGYQSAEATARLALESTSVQADATYLAALNQIVTDALATLSSLQQSADTAMDQAVATFAAADAAAFSVLEVAWTAAGTDETALQQSVDDFNATIVHAYDQFTAAYTAVVATAQAGVSLAQTQFDAATDNAVKAWLGTTTAAFIAYTATTQAAWAGYVVAEQGAWNGYVAAQVGPIQPREQMPVLPPPAPRTMPAPAPLPGGILLPPVPAMPNQGPARPPGILLPPVRVMPPPLPPGGILLPPVRSSPTQPPIFPEPNQQPVILGYDPGQGNLRAFVSDRYGLVVQSGRDGLYYYQKNGLWYFLPLAEYPRMIW